ncbi:DUF927 domain-containing protein [Legionella pneumophila]|uniref:DUF927 domain-containing protein n=1 Tax=Legionella pneumophila TaxID=446 RepID=UPI00101FB3C8|nr:DUF927 domain-containing protein [Legionella pneumophila]RYW92013.1 DUF927 domain-containing protein [Legionella pneumophila]HAT1775836.1 DUF927 domain-containing protein [Legionella pneumophila]HAT1778292.1 DUF927 domain-containing protein [Legionella pneumophila]HAT2018670.1 DUF927 domain-containing protein [Legionella pneumophila]HAT2024599.1 DUF927 domain-containing protein [Legionella pneumophila]
MFNNQQEKYKGTQGTEGTIKPHKQYRGSSTESRQQTEGTNLPGLEIISPLDIPEDKLNRPHVKRPSFQTHDDWFQIEDKQLKPGLYYHNLDKYNNPEDIWICTPIHVDAFTCNEHGGDWGMLLRAINPDGQWKEWTMPNYLLKGGGEEIRGELLAMGVRISPEATRYFLRWLSSCHSLRRMVAVRVTGWHKHQDNLVFVMPNKVIGAEGVRFQSDHAVQDDFKTMGTITEWKNQVGRLCRNNPILLLAASCAFAGALLKLAKLQEVGGFGIHLMGDSSQGKTTALQVAASIWGSPSFMRTWRATANGLEAIAATRNDTFLTLDESGECEPRDIGTVIYALANGIGKQRASRTGAMREAKRWRISVLSSGECSINVHMGEAGKRIKAGQEARLLNVPATKRTYGAFDDLHDMPDGRTFADNLKRATSNQFGHTGLAFVEHLVAEDIEHLPTLYAEICNSNAFFSNDGVASRAAGIFALIGFAGELATKYGLTGWDANEALHASIMAYQSWHEFRGEGKTEDRQILNALTDFVLKHGDSRFSLFGEAESIKNRAGWWKNSISGRVYMFTSEALQEAVSGFDLRKILDTLEDKGWLVERDIDKRAKSVKLNGATARLYHICVGSNENA